MKKIVIALFSSAIILASSAASAQLYIGGSLGEADFGDDLTDNSFTLLGGYNLNEMLALEFSYIDAGSVNGNASVDFATATPTSVATTLVFEKPIYKDISLVANFGLHLWEVDVTSSSGDVEKFNGSDLTFGIGAELHINELVSAVLKWQRYDVVLYDEDEAMDNVSIGVRINIE